MAVEYTTLDVDLESCTEVRAKIVKIDAIIDELLNTAMKSVATGNIAQYKIDTGQSTQMVVYSSTKQITDTIKEYEKIRTMYVNKLAGHQFKLIDGKNLNRG